MDGSLTPLQRRILRELAGMDPRWVLTGGGALAGFYLGHRVTRDLDLFFRERAALDDIPREVAQRLRSDGLRVEVQRSAPAFQRLDVDDGQERIEVDLVADLVPAIEAPVEVSEGIWADSRHEILVNMLGALLGRVAVRDLVDLAALLDAGGDLERGLVDAARKDGGFSPPTLAWLLASFPVAKLAVDSGFDPEPLVVWRDRLVERLLAP